MKGSGGDLGTLTEAGLAVLRLDRAARARRRVSGRGARGRDGRRVRLLPPRSRRRGTVDRHRDARRSSTAAHVDHLHPDSGIAIATAADGEQLTKDIYGDRVVWVPWRRPGFQLGLDIAAIHARPSREPSA